MKTTKSDQVVQESGLENIVNRAYTVAECTAETFVVNSMKGGDFEGVCQVEIRTFEKTRNQRKQTA